MAGTVKIVPVEGRTVKFRDGTTLTTAQIVPNDQFVRRLQSMGDVTLEAADDAAATVGGAASTTPSASASVTPVSVAGSGSTTPSAGASAAGTTASGAAKTTAGGKGSEEV